MSTSASALEIAQKANFITSLTSLSLLVIVLPPYLLPSTLTGIPSDSPTRLSAPTISLVFLTAARAGCVNLDVHARQGNAILCGVDALLCSFLLTGMVAHLPLVALTRLLSLPTPAAPRPPPPSRLRTAALLILAYVYALLPLIPTLAVAAMSKLPTQGEEAFAGWWGFYCLDKAGWIRIVRPATLASPAALTLILSTFLLSALYSTADHPSPEIRPTKRMWASAALLVVVAAGIIIYVAMEQAKGWHPDWWPRCFESIAGLVLFFTLASDLTIWRTYLFWIRLRRPISSASSHSEASQIEIGLGTYIMRSTSHQSKMSAHKRSSSFFTPPLVLVRDRLPKPDRSPKSLERMILQQPPTRPPWRPTFSTDAQSTAVERPEQAEIPSDVNGRSRPSPSIAPLKMEVAFGSRSRSGSGGSRSDGEIEHVPTYTIGHGHGNPLDTPPTAFTRPPTYTSTQIQSAKLQTLQVHIENDSGAPSPPFQYNEAMSTIYSEISVRDSKRQRSSGPGQANTTGGQHAHDSVYSVDSDYSQSTLSVQPTSLSVSDQILSRERARLGVQKEEEVEDVIDFSAGPPSASREEVKEEMRRNRL